MRPVTLARASMVAHQICLVLLIIGILGFAAMIAVDIAPRFSQELALGDETLLEIHNGSACPRSMPSYVCYSSGLGYRREFRIVYHSLHQPRVVMAVSLPWR